MAAPATFRHPSADVYLEPVLIREAIGDDVRSMPVWKRAIDVTGAGFGLLLLAPFFAVVALIVAVESPGGPFFRQVRVGKGGRTFTCWKFRTMHRDAERMKAGLLSMNEASGHIFKIKNDPRRTRVGIFLRKTSIDELPQLWNVFRGDMSLVGPRPPIPAEVAAYTTAQLRRLSVEPGITGLWQVTLRGRHDFADMVALDVEYALHRSLWLDLRIFALTAVAVVRGEGSC
ncbi:MAG: sugar transferase [Dehalococcoidia bacterium]|nr:sugar transferase [Dehalococcoidia bacterium]MCB9486043.1 sugar transferase [Thermoflexaceae bacterium]